jgi:RHS repeat-associated protein
MTFAYDGDGRLVKLVKNGVTEYRFYDGAQCYLRTDAGGTALDWTVWGPTPDEVISRNVSGAWQYYHQDQINSVYAVTNAGGSVLERYLYDAFGAPDVRDVNWNTRASTAIDNPWLFTGQEWRADVQLANYKARWYQPTLGRFMQNDPVRFDAGDINLYRYCENDPVNRMDSTGMWIETAWDVANIAMGVGSAISNAKKGNWGAAAVDAGGAVVDTIAAAVPFVPGGFGTAIKVARAADKTADAVKTAGKVEDAARASKIGVDGKAVKSWEDTSASLKTKGQKNINTNESKESFETKLKDRGFEASTAKDGSPQLKNPDTGVTYTVKESSKTGPPTAYRNDGSGPTHKIRFEQAR